MLEPSYHRAMTSWCEWKGEAIYGAEVVSEKKKRRKPFNNMERLQVSISTNLSLIYPSLTDIVTYDLKSADSKMIHFL